MKCHWNSKILQDSNVTIYFYINISHFRFKYSKRDPAALSGSRNWTSKVEISQLASHLPFPWVEGLQLWKHNLPTSPSPLKLSIQRKCWPCGMRTSLPEIAWEESDVCQWEEGISKNRPFAQTEISDWIHPIVSFQKTGGGLHGWLLPCWGKTPCPWNNRMLGRRAF